jgi:putative phage-type endonuclease
MTAIFTRPTAEEWQAARPHHVNASEMGTIAGVSKYGSIADLYNQKVNAIVKPVENEAMLWGHVFEDGVARMFEHKTGLEVIKSSDGDWQFIREEEPWMACSPDRTYWLEGATRNARDWKSKGLLECKTTTTDPEAEGNDWMLKSWYCQVQWQLMVAEMEEAHLCCCVMGYERKTIIRHWPANKEFQARLYDLAKAFWFGNVQTQTPPAPRTEDDVRKLFPEHTPGKVAEATDEVNQAVLDLKMMKSLVKETEAKIAELQDKVAVAIGDAESLSYQGMPLATYKSQTSTRLDSKRLKAEKPEVYGEYATQGTTRVLRLK